jgi:hypothetical protein
MDRRPLKDGDHVDQGQWTASGTVRAFASGNANVWVSGMARVWASGHAQVDCLEKAGVVATDGARSGLQSWSRATLVDPSPIGHPLATRMDHVTAYHGSVAEAFGAGSLQDDHDSFGRMTAHGRSLVLLSGGSRARTFDRTVVVVGSRMARIDAFNGSVVRPVGMTHRPRAMLHDHAVLMETKP